jgi:hypothetical protein
MKEPGRDARVMLPNLKLPVLPIELGEGRYAVNLTGREPRLVMFEA